MVFMAVRKHESLHPVLILKKIRNIRDDQVNPVHVILRKSQSAVHHHNAVIVFESSDVHADLFKAAQRYNLQSFCCFVCHRYLLLSQFCFQGSTIDA